MLSIGLSLSLGSDFSSNGFHGSVVLDTAQVPSRLVQTPLEAKSFSLVVTWLCSILEKPPLRLASQERSALYQKQFCRTSLFMKYIDRIARL